MTKLSSLLLAVGVLILGTAASQVSARMVKDLNRGPGAFSAAVDSVTTVRHGAVFRMTTLANGPELWVSDGTPRGTRLLKDILPGPLGSDPQSFVMLDGIVFFSANDGVHGIELWCSDGTEEGTRLVMDTVEGPEGGYPVPLVGSLGRLYFLRYDWSAQEPVTLWSTDGTAEGTLLLNPPDENGERRFQSGADFTHDGTWTYFVSDELELWRTDGTPEGSSPVADLWQETGGRYPMSLKAVGGRLVFGALGPADDSVEFWSLMPGQGSAMKIGPLSGGWIYNWRSVVSGGHLFFSTTDDELQPQFWTSDGTVEGTREVNLRHGGQPLAANDELAEWNGVVYFASWNEATGVEIGRSDGTDEGSWLLKDIRPGPAGSSPSQFTAAGDFLYFRIEAENGHSELWRTDGTTAGTRRVTSLDRPHLYYSRQVSAASGDNLLFASGSGADEALWKTGGTKRQTLRLTRPEKSTGSSFRSQYGDAVAELDNRRLLMAPRPDGVEQELWTIGGTVRSGRAVWKSPSVLGQYGEINFMGRIGSRMAFSVSNVEENLRQIWTTDGTRRGTRLLRDHSGDDGGYPATLMEVGGVWFYGVYQPVNGPSTLWQTDGTPEGTRPAIAADGTVLSPVHGESAILNGILYFIARELGSSRTLWRTDGTSAGTWQVARPVSGTDGGPRLLTAVGDRLTFFADRGAFTQLWTSDGTAGGTKEVYQARPEFQTGRTSQSVDLAGRHLFLSNNGYLNPEWWVSDGTDAGTAPLRNDEDQSFASGYRFFAVAGDILYGVASRSDELGWELWRTDGTGPGSYRVKDIRPGPQGSNPTEMIAAGDMIYFSANDGIHGTELWQSDGTEAGTVMIADVEPGPLGSGPAGLKVSGGKLYFHAERQVTGRELHVIDLPPDH